MKSRRMDGELGRVLACSALAAAVLLALCLVAAAPAAAPVQAAVQASGPWVLAAGVTGTLNVIDASTDIVYGPYLSGELGSSGGGLFDVAVTPNGQTALVSNFGDSAVYAVDVSDPLNPTFISSATLTFFAEDIVAVSDRFALVTDGGFSYVIAVLDLASMTQVSTVTLPAFSAQAVDIAPDGTVIVVDYFASVIQSLYPDATGELTVTGVYTFALTPEGHLAPAARLAGTRAAQPAQPSAETGDELRVSVLQETILPRPVNVAIAPDGQTVIVPGVSAYGTPTETLYALGVYRIISPGVLTFTQAITGLPRAAQSIAFDEGGTKVYLNANGGDATNFDNYSRLMVLDILGPGRVRVNDLNAADMPRTTSSQLFGVDTIAVANAKAYLGYQTTSGAKNDLRVVDLSTYSVKRLDMPGICTGVAVIPTPRIYLPIVLR